MSADADVVVLMPCGFDLERTIRESEEVAFPDSWQSLPAVREGNVFAVDGSAYFNRPGPRLVDGIEILAAILHPDVFEREGSDGFKRLQRVVASPSPS